MNRTAIYRLLRRHGLSVRAALSIVGALLPQDWVRRLDSHPRGVVFKAAVAHYLRRVAEGQCTSELRVELRHLAAAVLTQR